MDRQWDQLKKLEQSHLSLEEVYVEKKKADPNEAISWELYKNLTYGYITGQLKNTLHQENLLMTCKIMTSVLFGL